MNKQHYGLYVETDDDFSIRYAGNMYYNDFWLYFDSPDELENIEVFGPFGSEHTEDTKSSEFFEGLEIIKDNPNDSYDSTGGNRGIMWYYGDSMVDRPEPHAILSEEQQDAIRNAWLDMGAFVEIYNGDSVTEQQASEIIIAMSESIAELEKTFPFLLGEKNEINNSSTNS